MKWLKKVAATPLTSIAKVIDGFNGANKNTNAPSIRAVEEALDAKASNDDLTAATMELNAAIAEKADTNAMFLERAYNFTYSIGASNTLSVSANDLGIYEIQGYTPIAFQRIATGNKNVHVWGFHARYGADFLVYLDNRSTSALSDLELSVRVIFVRNDVI